MKLLIDDARLSEIQRLWDIYPVDGVTTNPTILARAGGKPYETLKAIRAFIGPEAELHVQVVAKTADGIVADGLRIVKELGRETYVKIPVNAEGLRATRLLTRLGVRVTATAIHTPMQAFLAAKNGAVYAAPYVNRIDNMGFDGVQAAKDIHDIYRKNGLEANVLAASFKNTRQALELCRYGVGAVTLAPEIMEDLARNAATEAAVENFTRVFEGLAGEGRTMADC